MRSSSSLLLLVVAVIIFLVAANYLFVIEFPVIEWKYSRPPDFRPAKPEEIEIRLFVAATIDVVVLVGGAAWLFWYHGERIRPNESLLPIEGEPIKGELLMPLEAIGYSPPAEPIDPMDGVEP